MKPFFPKTFIFLSFLFFFSQGNVTAQFNIKVGYGGAYIQNNEVNAVYERFNAERPWLDQPLGDLHTFGGLELGLRYRKGFSAIELSWLNIAAESEALGTDPGNKRFTETLYTAIRNYAIGVQTYWGNIGFGVNIGKRRVKMENEVSGFDLTSDFYKETVWSSRYQLLLQVPSQNMAITLSPYMDYPWETYNVQALEREYFPDSTRPSEEFDTRMVTFGISLLIYNGPQDY